MIRKFLPICSVLLACTSLPVMAGLVADSTRLTSRIDTSSFVLPPIDSTNSTVPAGNREKQRDTLTEAKKRADSLTGLTGRISAGIDSADTAYEFWQFPFWTLSASFSLGNAPLFSLWENGLADSLGSFGLLANAYRHGLNNSIDTLLLQLQFREKPNSYNVAFPIAVSLVLPMRSGSFVTLGIGGEVMTKRSLQIITADSAGNEVALDQSLTVGSVGLGARCDIPVPTRFFLVQGVERTSFFFGLQVDPLIYLRNKSDVSIQNGADSLFSSVLEKVRTGISGKSGFGYGCTWRVGVVSLKRYAMDRALLTGLSYRGSWQRFTSVTNKDLNRSGADKPDAQANGIIHRLTIDLELCMGRKKPAQ